MAFTSIPVSRVGVYLGADHIDSDIAYQVNFPNEDGNVLGDCSRSGDFNGDGLDDWMYSSFYGDTLQRGYIRIISGDPRFGLPVGEEPPPVVREFTVGNPYPNPFNSTLSISLTVPLHQDVTVSLYDLLGREVDVLHHGRLSNPTLSYTTPASLSSGLYFLRAQTKTQSVMRKVVLLK